MKVILETYTEDERQAIYKKYEGQKPSQILKELIEYIFYYEYYTHPAGHKLEYPIDTIQDLEVVLLRWLKSNAQIEQNKENHKDRKFNGGNPFNKIETI